MTPDEAYEHCRRLTRSAARNFYYGIRLLPRAKRLAICAIYALSRICDDAVDEHPGGDGALRLAAARELLLRAWDDTDLPDDQPVAVALRDAVRRFRLPYEPFAALLAGLQMDIDGRSYRTFAELKLYCERVAGSVGHLCLIVFGYSHPSAPALALDMGVALQLTNILRDLREDASRGRIYLPSDEMTAAGYTAEDLRAGRHTPGFARLMGQQVARARELYDRSAALFPLVAADARLCPMALHGVYRELLERIAESGYDVLRRRVRVPTARKLQLVGSLLWQQQRVRVGRV